MEVELQQKIKAQIEQAKKDLSTLQKKSYTISYDGDRTRIELTREDFESRTQDLVEQTMDFVNHLLEETGFSTDNVDVVLLVGGSTKMPMIRTAVEAMFPGKVRVEDPIWQLQRVLLWLLLSNGTNDSRLLPPVEK